MIFAIDLGPVLSFDLAMVFAIGLGPVLGFDLAMILAIGLGPVLGFAMGFAIGLGHFRALAWIWDCPRLLLIPRISSRR